MHKNRLHLLLFMELKPKNTISKCLICIYVQQQKKKKRWNSNFFNPLVTVFNWRFPIVYTNKLQDGKFLPMKIDFFIVWCMTNSRLIITITNGLLNTAGTEVIQSDHYINDRKLWNIWPMNFILFVIFDHSNKNNYKTNSLMMQTLQWPNIIPAASCQTGSKNSYSQRLNLILC